MKKTLITFLAAIVFSVFAADARATTWFDKEFVCPVDGEKNTFMVIGSYGSYIYSWPSKYQWIFWPETDSPTYYTCRKCHYSAYMWDFENLPKDKIVAVKAVLTKVTVSKPFKKYTELSVSERLEIIEKVYAVLGRDDDFWEKFHRTKGYHYDAESKPEKATASRKKSLEMVGSMIKSGKSATPQKLLWYISGAMRHFTGDDDGAIADLQKALTVKFEDKNAKPEEVASAESNLNERIGEYIALIKGKEKPRLSEQ